MIFRIEEISSIAAAMVARWQRLKLEAVQRQQSAAQLGMDYPREPSVSEGSKRR